MLVKRMIRRSLAAHRRGDVEALLRTYARDVRFHFPGQSSFAADLEGVDAVRPWLQRFHRLGIEIDVDEILVAGWPWNTRAALHFTDRFRAPGGAVIYENSGFIYAKSAWGKIREYEVVEDTEKVARFDEWLTQNEARLGSARAS
jgi:ketosteroid isomerase-like protein